MTLDTSQHEGGFCRSVDQCGRLEASRKRPTVLEHTVMLVVAVVVQVEAGLEMTFH